MTVCTLVGSTAIPHYPFPVISQQSAFGIFRGSVSIMQESLCLLLFTLKFVTLHAALELR